jgi:predicted Zn-dependent protease
MHGIQHLVPLVCLLPGQVAPPSSPADALGAQSQRGKELMAAGRYAEAVPVYRDLVAALPGNPGLLLNLGMALHLSGADEEAITPLAAAVELQPALLPASLFLGASNLRLGRVAAAIAPLQKVVRLDPSHREARSMLAEALVATEDYAAAEPHLRRLARSAPADPAAWFNLGNAYEELAGQAAAELREGYPDSPFALALAAEERSKRGQSAAAFHLYRKAIERGPEVRGLHAAVAGIYRSAGHPDWAALEEQKERRRAKPDCARQRVECAFLARRYHDVVAAAAGPSEPDARYWRARAYAELASQAFGRLAALPPSALFHERMAEERRNERRYTDSIDHWRRAMVLSPEDPRLRMELAVTLRQNRDFAAAQEVLEELHRAAPDAPDLNYFLGDVLLAREEPARAIPFLEKAVRLDPSAPHAQGALGRAYALAGRPADAISHLKQALPADVDGSLRYQLARAYQATGQQEQARLALQDYEVFRGSLDAGSDTGDEGAITPPR